MPRVLLVLLFLCAAGFASAQPVGPITAANAFRPLDARLPTPTEVRLASGAPGPAYWQQRADYVIDVTLDDAAQRVIGKETVTYHNRSPHTLRYLWLQVDPNLFAPDSEGARSDTAPELGDKVGAGQLLRLLARQTFDGSATIESVTDAADKPLPHTVIGTMLRIDLPRPLAAGGTTTFKVAWHYRVNPSRTVGGRTGFETLADGQRLYTIAQWFPRMCAYTDVAGWQHRQFHGRAEFALEFGDYRVRITAPADFVVTATGELTNAADVLSDAQRKRLSDARTARKPMYVITPDEAQATRKATATAGTRTWQFEAKNVRDVAFAASRAFIWDARGVAIGARTVMAMSLYPAEGQPLWHRYSTEAVAHTLEVYSRHCVPYPYPVAISVNGPVGGMEYPMICFNGPRPETDGTYSARTKYGLIGVVIHEVGHNWFPMIVNSDERQWTWMDEGINTFVQYLAECAWSATYPSRRGEASKARTVAYMKSANQVPIMTNGESLLQFGNNAYGKTATALNVLRETVLGRERFDFAFREYCRRWAFKRPMPADFFRSLEDASGTDLDWFWRGWFFTTHHTDQAIVGVRRLRMAPPDPADRKRAEKAAHDARPRTIGEQRNQGLTRRTDRDPTLKDFYDTRDRWAVSEADRAAYKALVKRLDAEERKLLESDHSLYVIEISNSGGLVMPVILRLELADGSTQELRIPAWIWRKDPTRVKKLVITRQTLVRVVLDPHRELPDTERANNQFPPAIEDVRFRLTKDKGGGGNPMRAARKQAEKDAKRKDRKGKDGTR